MALADGDGERVLLAAATLYTRLGELGFGVLDYGEDTTYLLLPDPIREDVDPVPVLLEALTEHELLSPELILEGNSSYAEETSLAARVAVLERCVETLSAAVRPAEEIPHRYERSAVPGARLSRMPAVSPDPTPRGEEGRLPEPHRERRTGVVKWLDRRRGYGFITPDDGSEDVYFHHSVVIDKRAKSSFAEGTRVRWSDAEKESPVEGPQGKRH